VNCLVKWEKTTTNLVVTVGADPVGADPPSEAQQQAFELNVG